MLTSNLYAPTLREMPSDAEIKSHRLMLRAGMIRKAAGGVYTYLPLAWRTIKKIEQIIREEMDNAGGQELCMPIMQPAEIWQESGRWSVFGSEMFRLQDCHGRAFCLGPTHEEMITTLVRDEVRSYKQLPLLLYQIQNKYRDEIRPRFGLMRSREFIMKDLYSFDKDEESANISYQKMYDAYTNIFTRCGLKFRPVEADAGAIGGNHTHEFTVLAAAGESEIACCTACGYAANVEKAELLPLAKDAEEAQPLKKVKTPNCKTIELVANYLHAPLEKTIKAVAFQDENATLVLALVRGDHEVNEVKLQNTIGAFELQKADEAAIQAAGAVAGFMSPIGIKKSTKIVVDSTVMNMKNCIAGANEVDMHYTGVNPARDFTAVITKDIRLIKAGDPCPQCNAPIEITRGIEAGQVFKLGTKYSKSLGATFLDENGKEKSLFMGCYGIGVGRTMAAAIEQHNDEHGIIWPRAIAPYEVIVIAVNIKSPEQKLLGEEIYQALLSAGIDAVFDDRKDRAGVKFKDADLIGYPLRITVGAKAIEEDTVEIKVRSSGEIFDCKKKDCLKKVEELLQNHCM